MASLPRVKVCGVTSVENAVAVARLGVDAIGLNFYAKSPRFVSIETAEKILANLPPLVEPIGLFVNDSVDYILQTADRLRIRTVQLHGDIGEFPSGSPIRVIRAFPVKDVQSLDAIEAFLKATDVRSLAGVLVDAHVAGQFGGTGKTAPWELLRDWPFQVPLMLAGGLNPDNVAQAVHAVRPFAVDVASGVESSPGVKDLELVRRFIARACSGSAP